LVEQRTENPRVAGSIPALATNSFESNLMSRAGKSPSHREMNALVALFNAGRYAEAAILAQTMTARFPLHAFGWKALGAAWREMGWSEDALKPMQQAATLLPGDAEAHTNVGNTLTDLGRLEEAEASHRRALEITPDFAEAHYNLGNTLADLGRLGEAEASYREAVRLRPDYVDALNNSAFVLNMQGKSMLALDMIKQSLEIRETDKAKEYFVASVKGLRFKGVDSPFRALMARALSEPWGRPAELAESAINVVKLDPEIGSCMARASSAWPRRLPAQELFGTGGLAANAADPLLRALLESVPACDIEMERFLTMARCSLLEAAIAIASPGGEAGTALSFYCALARQCFINEYVFSCADDEIRKARGLRDALAAALEAGTEVPVLWPVAVAAYFPLCSLPLAGRLSDRRWPEPVTAVLEQQVRQPAQELQLRSAIPRLTAIEDEVSLLVQNQYEENPYPRWIAEAPGSKPLAIDAAIRRILPLAPIHPLGKHDKTDVLIAGCGTGQHAIGTAQLFQGAKVLAVDLSLSSLSYAWRKTREMGLTSIDYAQADLLKLSSIGRRFDVIESVGVLHHLADPWAGWRALLSLLCPGGFMKLGFYSEVARRNVNKARAVIAERGYGATANEIRRCRQDLMSMDETADFGLLLKSNDFFSTSSCRDLLFHVQEKHTTLTAIDAFLREHGLTFLGFESSVIVQAYKRRFPDDHAAVNLAQWQIFENENPDTFARMYQFWVQAKGQGTS
jgi:tetratricopeptide (TPR) repeat protein/2-polyprenyl-3-methyl-5-hydroxy-6-metoxy-1,4-benzoquinol methylase